MKTLQHTSITSEYPSLLEYQVLIYSEKSRLIHCTDIDFKYHYLCLWVDADKEHDRWLSFEVESKNIRNYLKRKVTLFELLKTTKGKVVYIVDVTKEETPTGSCESFSKSIIIPNHLPEEYLPALDSYYTSEPMPPIRDIGYELIELDNEWSLEDFSAFSRLFEELYAFTSTLTQGRISQVVTEYPWRGGYSNIGFYNRILAQTKELKVNSIHYASPGYLKLGIEGFQNDYDDFQRKLKLLAATAFHYIKNKDIIEHIYKQCERYIRKNQLNERKVEANEIELHDSEKTFLSTYFDKITSILELDKYIGGYDDNTVFALVKAFMSYIRKLRTYEEKWHSEGRAKIAWVSDALIKNSSEPTEGERVLAILEEVGYLGSMPDVPDLSENYKDYLDWGHKI